ncbi:hypothetical protein TWF191_003852 [Orbilia oligospora]|uniref:Uncharacterized protein n=1 Tax=Orbilia oligospora TaxID=2813651 RepID=A0A7C8VF16_ORBOL|nr:hypothetical protein TWF191_003852 [Orbilia oligospora]
MGKISSAPKVSPGNKAVENSSMASDGKSSYAYKRNSSKRGNFGMNNDNRNDMPGKGHGRPSQGHKRGRGYQHPYDTTAATSLRPKAHKTLSDRNDLKPELTMDGDTSHSPLQQEGLINLDDALPTETQTGLQMAMIDDSSALDASTVSSLESTVSTDIESFCLTCGSGPLIDGLCRLCSAADEIHALRDQLSQKNSSNIQITKNLNRHKDELDKMQNKVKEQEKEIQQSKQDYNRLNEQWKSDYSNLQQKLKNVELEIGKLQRTELAMLHREEPLMDRKAKDDLQNCLRTKIQAISRPFSRKIIWRDSAKRTPDLPDVLPGLFTFRWVGAPWQMIRDSPGFATSSFVDAMLFTALTTKFFKNPFFRAEGDPTFKGTLDKFYMHSCEKDFGVAEAWRKITVNFLKEPSFADKLLAIDEWSDKSYSHLNLRRTSQEITALLHDFITLHYKVTDSESSTLGNKVYELVCASAELAEDWLSREFRFTVVDLDWIEANQIYWGTEAASKYTEPKNRNLKETAQYIILAVISPGFIRYETGDRLGMDTEIVWQKATVLLGEIEGFGSKTPDLASCYSMETNEWLG